jgi:nucleotide-binding universal stress UspA family protein
MLKVLIAVDGSPAAQQALDFAHDLLMGKPASIALLHVIPQHIVYGRTGAAPAETFDLPSERAAVTELLGKSAAQLQAGGTDFQITQEILLGDVAEKILTYATNQNAADLIILGSRGLNAAQRFLVGSVSTRVTTHAHCAVMVVHPRPVATNQVSS